jgi:hypothetical protein
VRELLGAEVFTHYGTVETGLGGAVDCAAHEGCHLREGDLLVEIIDPHTTRPVVDGTWGEIVCTTLTRTGMPLIRYRTGDRGRLLPGVCGCGSAIRRLDRVQGRIDQVRTLAHGGRLALAELDELLFALPGLLDCTAALVTVRRSALDRLTRYPSLRELPVTLDLAPGTLIQPAKRTLEDHREDPRS